MDINLDIRVAAFLFSLLASVTDVDSGCRPLLKCNCTSTAGTVRCQGDKAPCTIPSNTEDVYITGLHLVEKNNQHPFNDSSWQNVSLLDITVEMIDRNFTIEAGCFIGLANLEYLGIHGITLVNPNIDVSIALMEESFYGLDNLRTLDLSKNPLLDVRNVIISLSKSSIIPNLETLSLNYLSQIAGTNVKLGALFFQTLSTRPIKSLSFDNTTLNIEHDNFNKICETLEEFSARSSTVTLFTSDNVFSFPKCKSLSKLDLSNSKIDYLELIIVDYVIKHPIRFREMVPAETIDKRFGFLFTVQQLFLNKIISSNCKFNSGIAFDLKNIKSHTKILQFRGNNIQWFNVSITNIGFPSGTEMDISDNTLAYIHPKSLYPGKNIRKLDLSKNKLHVMAKEHSKDFAKFLHVFSDLEILNLSSNGLPYIPYEMFQPGSSNLTNIDLSRNHLKVFPMHWENFNSLQYLNVSQNEIVILDATQMGLISSFVASLQATANTREASFRLNLGENPYKCGCSNIEFPAWIRSSDFVVKNDKLQCEFDGEKFDMKYEAFELIRNICDHKETVRISLMTSGVSLCVILVAIACFIVLRRQKVKKQRINQVLKQIKNGDWAERYLVFLSFSSEDGDFVMEHVYPKLILNLQALTGIIQDFVCVGEKHFRPGYPIIDEVISTMKLSSIVIFVLSMSFCGKRWCEMEVREAYENQKPIILMCKEEIKESLMSPLLLKIFHRNTRSNVTLNQDGECVSQPNWPVLCSSIIQLTSE